VTIPSSHNWAERLLHVLFRSQSITTHAARHSGQKKKKLSPTPGLRSAFHDFVFYVISTKSRGQKQRLQFVSTHRLSAYCLLVNDAIICLNPRCNNSIELKFHYFFHLILMKTKSNIDFIIPVPTSYQVNTK